METFKGILFFIDTPFPVKPAISVFRGLPQHSNRIDHVSLRVVYLRREAPDISQAA